MTELFVAVLRERLGWRVETAAHPDEVSPELVAAGGFEVAVVDLSYGRAGGRERTDGLGLLRRLHHAWPGTRLVAATDGDRWADGLLVEARVTLPLAGVLHKTAPIAEQVARLQAIVGNSTVNMS